MKKKASGYSAELKTKVVLEILREEKTIPEIAQKYEVPPTTIRDWKRQFLENAHLAFTPGKEVQELKGKLKEAAKEKEHLYKEVGQLTVMLNWAKKKSAELGLEY